MSTSGRTLVFETTNAVLWGEEVAQAAGIPVEVVPAPAASDAKCDLALACGDDDGDRLEAIGYGESKPIASNKRRKGRAANRRVEFNIVQAQPPAEPPPETP